MNEKPKMTIVNEPFSGLKNIWQLRKDGVLPFYQKLWQEHGDLVSFKVGAFNCIFICNPHSAREILVEKQKEFIKGASWDIVRLFTGNGLLTANGADWITQRRMVKGEFTLDSIRNMYQDMCMAIKLTTGLFDEAIKKATPLDIFEAMRVLAMNIVSATLFGRKCTKSAELNEAFLHLINIGAQKSMTLLGKMVYFPTMSNWRFLKARSKIYQITDNFTHNNFEKGYEPLIHRLVETGKEQFKDKALKKYLRDQVNTLFLAGHETTANALGWTWTLLGEYPEIRKRLEDELDSLTGEFPTFEEITKLKMLKNITMEVMRLYPPVWMVSRDATADATLHGEKIPKNTQVVISPYFIHRNPRYWPDPLTFNPDRFDELSDANTYFPFSLGSRKCLGEHFAVLEMSLAIAYFCKFYRFIPTAKLPEDEAAFTVRPKTEVNMLVKKREPSLNIERGLQ